MSDFFLADDLSGALDAAGAFHRAGRRVAIALSTEAWRDTREGDVVGFTTETRNAAPDVAAAAVANAIAFGRARGARLVYKKIDSTLRGAVAAELEALLTALPDARVLFSPANPAVGRTVRGGVLLVHGVPVAETEFGRDPVSPVRESDIRRLLGGVESARLEIADASVEEDLAVAVARMNAEGVAWVGVGSGALARPIAVRNEISISRTEDLSRKSAGGETPPGPTLMICGSAHRVNRTQAAALARERGVPVIEVRLGEDAAAVTAAITAIQASCGRGATLMIEERRGESSDVPRRLAAVTNAVVHATGVRRVFVTGGETAFALCGHQGIGSLAFEAEIESGLSLSRADATSGLMRLAIKPGGFGAEQTGVRAWEGLRV